MSWKSNAGNGGIVIKPSARKSIHSNCGITPANSRNMGRYGIPNVNRNNDQNICTSKGETGYDEVDNIMSKFARPASPVPVQRHNIIRRRSCDVNNESSDDESDDSNVLSKSSPPGISLCRDQLYTNDILQKSDINNINDSGESIHEYENESYNDSIEILQNNSINVSRQEINTKEESIISQTLLQGVLVVLFLCIPVFYAVYYPSEKTKVVNIYDKISFYNDVRDLGEKYKVKDTAIMEVRAGVATIFENRDTGSFIFTYNSNNKNFNPVKFDRFVEDIAAIASRYLRNYSKEHVVVVDTINLKMQSSKEFMNTYEGDVAKTGVMLVKDVDNMPPELAMAFHYYCDEYNPLVRQSAIFFTLNLAKCSNDSGRTSYHKYHQTPPPITHYTSTTKEFMNPYKGDVAKTGVMLVKDVENMPPELAMAFHYYCDEYNPLVRQSAIFFTLNLAKCSNDSDPESTYKYIEQCLSNKWSTTVGEDKIGALLNRVVNIVVDVTTY